MSGSFRSTDGSPPLVIIGWREWVTLPKLGITHIKAKIDTGARSSCLHAFEIEPFQRENRSMVRFDVHPVQRRDDISIRCEADVHDIRHVRSSSGEISERFVILTWVRWMGETWPVELTLANRSEMGFRMLIGREAIRNRMIVDPGRSYFGGRRVKKQKRRKPGNEFS